MEENGARGQDQHGQVDTYSASEAAEGIRRRDHLLAAALNRIPELASPSPSPSAERGSPETPAKKAPKGGTAPEPRPKPQTVTMRRSWWRRIVGG